MNYDFSIELEASWCEHYSMNSKMVECMHFNQSLNSKMADINKHLVFINWVTESCLFKTMFRYACWNIYMAQNWKCCIPKFNFNNIVDVIISYKYFVFWTFLSIYGLTCIGSLLIMCCKWIKIGERCFLYQRNYVHQSNLGLGCIVINAIFGQWPQRLWNHKYLVCI